MDYSDFVPFDIAKALKTIGFNVPCAFYFATQPQISNNSLDANS